MSKIGGGFEKLWEDKNFMSRVISIVWDESQCVSKWGDFRPEYKTAGNLRHLILRKIPFFIMSATLPPRILGDVMAILGMRMENTYLFLRSNDQPNVHLVVRKMKYPLNSFKDLSFLIPDDWDPSTGKPLPYKFIIFFDSISDSIAAAKYLRSRLPIHLRSKLKWFNSEMSQEFQDEECANFKDGQNWGLACSESFGMASFYLTLPV
jgi:ATP-dependent DNA helicase RecQ